MGGMRRALPTSAASSSASSEPRASPTFLEFLTLAVRAGRAPFRCEEMDEWASCVVSVRCGVVFPWMMPSPYTCTHQLPTQPIKHTHRHVRLPAAFPSLEAYAQGMGRALTEELNLTLHETVHISLCTYTYMYV